MAMKPGLHVTFVFSFNVCCPVLENTNVKCEHDQLLPWNPFLTFVANGDVTCKQGLNGLYMIQFKCSHCAIAISPNTAKQSRSRQSTQC